MVQKNIPSAHMNRRFWGGIRLLSAAVVLLIMLFPGQVRAEFLLQPSIMVSEEYNDNLLLEETQQDRDYITRVDPALTLHYQTALWLWDGNYTLDYRHYEKYRDYDRTDHIYTVRNLTEIVNHFFFVETTDDYRRVSTDITRDYTQQGAIVNQTEQHTFTTHPYMILKASDATTLTYGHQYRYVRYRGAGINRSVNSDYLKVETFLTSQLSSTLLVTETREKNSLNDNFVQVDGMAGLQYTYGDRSFLYARGGKSWFRYDSGARADHDLWDAGITHRFTPYTASASAVVRYVQDPLRIATREDSYTGSLARDTARSTTTASGTMREIKNAATNELTSRSREAQLTLRYGLTPRTSALAAGSHQRLDERLPINSHTDLTSASLRIEHLLTEQSTFGMEYRHVYSYSSGIAINNYTNNRAIVDLRILF